MSENQDLNIIRPMSLKTQAFRFILTGGLSAVVDLGLLSLFQLVFGLPVPIARTISFIAGTTTAYMINRRWTFQAESSTSRFLAVVALYAVTFFINIGLQTFCSALFESWNWNEALAMVVAFVIAQGTGTTINFIVQRTLIFRAK
ncbi:GtrA family protein [Corynebacterium callunae]|uniref:Membrane protein n=1 Tax=Corynebacterium callunae DSM 20147 TaxID=1121353 RepID=M1UCP1_9CORY|nr:GtrA family protein [Corynebacterium callunae]AGG65640.1 membrane protein [Corynebacterium callunae DSM 20147]